MVFKRLLFALALTLLLGAPSLSMAQSTGEKALDHDSYDIWNRVTSQVLSENGTWLVYVLAPGEGDGTLVARNLQSGAEFSVDRGASPKITSDSRFLVFTVEPMEALVDSLKEEGKKGDDLPKNSLGIIDLSRADGSGTPETFTVERVKSWQIPAEEGAYLAYLLEEAEEAPDSEDEAEEEEEEAAPARRPGGAGMRGGGGPGAEDDGKKKDTGTELKLRDLASGHEHTFQNVLAYAFDEEGNWLAYTAENEEGDADGVYAIAKEAHEATPVLTGEGKYSGLTLSDEGGRVAFLTTRDDWEAEDPTQALYYGILGEGEARLVANSETAEIPQGWEVSEHGDLSFSEEGSRLLFGTAPVPPENELEDLPDDDKVEVDIWSWVDPVIQPMQLVQASRERNRTYQAYASTDDLQIVQLGTLEIPEVTIAQKGEGDVAVASTNSMVKYGWYVSHDGSYVDVYLMDVATGNAEMVLEMHSGRAPNFSPDGGYLTWWDGTDLNWMSMDVATHGITNLTEDIGSTFFDKLDDHPDELRSYGSGGWLEDDEALLVYDEFDIWAIDPSGGDAPRNLTEGAGRDGEIRFRYVDPTRAGGGSFRGFGGGGGGADPIDAGEDALLSAFHVYNKQSGYYRDRFDGTRAPQQLIMGDYRYSGAHKAKDADVYTLTRSTFREFPDLWVTDENFSDMEKVTDANPQQAEYSWGDAEIIEWVSNDGIPLQGILVKPDGFDPSKKYPLMVYFYERNSDNLHSYRAPTPGTSVNQSFYVSRGYVYFVPDIPYEIGHPGESAIDAVVPGVLKIVDQGYVDKERIGAQGHSWGGYQLAYMITRTNLFAAVEAGAPVSNMTSAYGGIRWDSGMNRQFQYEHTQTRIGGSLWAETLRYINNSPLFEVDKITTPLLMIHNDKDGAVPWYQGIEMYMAMRRLQMPVWMFNYNGEPHGLRQRPNQKDWTIRMQQFFDHYLLDAPAPVWMTDGVPAVMKGKTMGLGIKKD